nr:MAG TPA: hypothetical protein [Caudoviricetes sp.]
MCLDVFTRFCGVLGFFCFFDTLDTILSGNMEFCINSLQT